MSASYGLDPEFQQRVRQALASIEDLVEELWESLDEQSRTAHSRVSHPAGKGTRSAPAASIEQEGGEE